MYPKGFAPENGKFTGHRGNKRLKKIARTTTMCCGLAIAENKRLFGVQPPHPRGPAPMQVTAIVPADGASHSQQREREAPSAEEPPAQRVAPSPRDGLTDEDLEHYDPDNPGLDDATLEDLDGLT